MFKQYHIWKSILQVVLGAIVVYNAVVFIPRFVKDSAKLGENGAGYMFGYIIGGSYIWLALIAFLIMRFERPERILRKKGLDDEVKNLEVAKINGTLTKDQYQTKLEQLMADLIKKTETATKNQDSAIRVTRFEKSIQNMDNLLEKKLISEHEYLNKSAALKINNDPVNISKKEVNELISGKEFTTEEMNSGKTFTPPMASRETEDLVKLVISDDYSKEAIYLAYLELLDRSELRGHHPKSN